MIAARIFTAAIGLLLALGISSISYFLLLWLGIASTPAVWVIQIAVVAGSFAAAFRFLRIAPPSAYPQQVPIDWMFPLVAVAALAFSALWVSKQMETHPHGNWDAWSMWNARAKFLASPSNWRNAVSPALESIHPDYPLLLPAVVAWPWRVAGEPLTAIPYLVAIAFAAAIFAVVAACAALARSKTAGYVAAILLFSGSTFIGESMSLYADVPLAAFLVASIALVVLDAGVASLVFAGVLAALAAWTKNEGILLLPVLLIATGLFRRIADSVKVLAGAAPVLAVLIAYKVLLAPATDQFTKQTGSAIASKILDPGRYALIAGAFTGEILSFAPLYTHPILLIALLAWALRFVDGAARKQAYLAGSVALAMAAAYFASFVVTPYDLKWHLETALSRLLVQIWPAAVLAVVLALRPAEDYVQAVPNRPAAKRSRTTNRQVTSSR